MRAKYELKVLKSDINVALCVFNRCEAYLAYVIDTVKARPSVSDIPIISDFPDVFPEELPGLPSQGEIKFAIDVVPGATSASITLYQIAPLVRNM